MRRHKTPTWLTIIPVALMMVGHWDSAAAATLAQRQEQSQRSRYADGVYTATGQYGGQPSFIIVTVTLKSGVIVAVSFSAALRRPCPGWWSASRSIRCGSASLQDRAAHRAASTAPLRRSSNRLRCDEWETLHFNPPAWRCRYS
jgi:hypothetical protein